MNSASLPLYDDRPSLHLLPSCSTTCLSGSPPGSRRSSLSSGHFSSGSCHQDLDLVETLSLPPGFRDNDVEKRVGDMVQSDVFPYPSEITHTPLRRVHAPSCATVPPLPSTHHCHRPLSCHCHRLLLPAPPPATRTPPRRVHCAVACHCTAAALYTLLPPSTRRRRRHLRATPVGRCPYVPSPASPLAAASTCSAALVRGLHARAMRSPGPSGCTLPSHASRLRSHLSHGPLRHPSVPPVSRPRPWPHLRPCPVSRPPSRTPSPPGPHLWLCPTSQPLSRAPSPPGPHPRPCDMIT